MVGPGTVVLLLLCVLFVFHVGHLDIPVCSIIGIQIIVLSLMMRGLMHEGGLFW